MKAVIYARYSSDSQREESIEGQLRECTAFAEKNGITILRHYIDRAYSAKTDNRPEFQNMIKDSNKKLFDMIITFNYKDGTKTITLDDVKRANKKNNTGSDLDCHGAPANKTGFLPVLFIWQAAGREPICRFGHGPVCPGRRGEK